MNKIYDYMVPLGRNCEIGVQMRRYFNFVESFPYTWAFVKDYDLFFKALENDHLILSGQLIHNKSNNMIFDEASGLNFHGRRQGALFRKFSQDEYDREKIIEIDELKSRICHQLDKLHKIQQSDSKILYILTTVTPNYENKFYDTPDSARELAARVENIVSRTTRNFDILIILANYNEHIHAKISEHTYVRSLKYFSPLTRVSAVECSDIDGWNCIFDEFRLSYTKTDDKQYKFSTDFSEIFFKDGYLKIYQDVAKDPVYSKDPLKHYREIGKHQGRCNGLNPPSDIFSAEKYINFYETRTKRRLQVNPWVHYVLHEENSQLDYLLFEKIMKSGLFDTQFYLSEYPVHLDISPGLSDSHNDSAEEKKKAGKHSDTQLYTDDLPLSSLEHYLEQGWKCGFDPSGNFSTSCYLSSYSDVKKAGCNPLLHYIKYGINEKRIITKHQVFPKFSLIMPTFNRIDRIGSSIESVLNQQSEFDIEYELVIVDDGSTDGTVEMIKSRYAKEIADNKIVLISAEHHGVSSARNTGVSRAKYNWIGYIDDDNILQPHYLDTFFRAIISNPYYQFLYAQHYIVSEQKITEHEFSRHQLLKGNFIDLGSICHTKKIFSQVGGFDESLTKLVDWDLILRLTSISSPLYIPEIIMHYSSERNYSRITTTVQTKQNSVRISDKNRIEINIYEELENLKKLQVKNTDSINNDLENLKKLQEQNTDSINNDLENLKKLQEQNTDSINNDLENLKKLQAQNTDSINNDLENLKKLQKKNTDSINNDLENLKKLQKKNTDSINNDLESLHQSHELNKNKTENLSSLFEKMQDSYNQFSKQKNAELLQQEKQIEAIKNSIHSLNNFLDKHDSEIRALQENTAQIQTVIASTLITEFTLLKFLKSVTFGRTHKKYRQIYKLLKAMRNNRVSLPEKQ